MDYHFWMNLLKIFQLAETHSAACCAGSAVVLVREYKQLRPLKHCLARSFRDSTAPVPDADCNP